MKVFLSTESAEALGVDPRRHSELNVRAVQKTESLFEAQGIKFIGNAPGIIFVDVTGATQRAVADFLSTIRASAVEVQPADAMLYFGRGHEANAVSDFIRNHKGEDVLISDCDAVEGKMRELWKKTGPETTAPNWNEVTPGSELDTDDSEVQRAAKYANLTREQLEELREWGADETEDEAYVLNQQRKAEEWGTSGL